jgi:uncharacterized membrane protein YvlD (DUF360 family)
MLFLWGIIANLAACFIIWGTQELESKTGRIPKRHTCAPEKDGGLPILYCQDMLVFLVGDLVGLSLVNAALFYAFSIYSIPLWLWVFSFTIFVTDITYFMLTQTKKYHRPDAGAPGNGQLSVTGWAHLIYHGYFVGAVAVYFVLTLTQGINAQSFIILLIGATVWAVASLCDLRKGIFKRTNSSLCPEQK